MLDYPHLKREVMLSWQRCRRLGLKQDMKKPRIALNINALQAHFEQYEILISAFTNSIPRIANTINRMYLFLLTDPEGILLNWYITSNAKTDCFLGYSDLNLGISFSEESIGTNAIALAKKLKKPFFLIPEYHYCSFFHDWYCYAIPLFASEQLVGLLDVSTISDPLIEEMITVINLLGDKITTNYIKNNGFKVFNQTSAQRRIGAEILTDKQMEVLRLVVNGRTEIAIALELGISIPTVKYHKKKIFTVLGASCSNEAIIKAVKIGLITIR